MQRFWRLIIVYIFLLPLSGHLFVALYYRLDEKRYQIGKLEVTAEQGFKLQSGNSSYNVKRPGLFVPVEELPEVLVAALIYQEDQNFFNHRGYSIRDIQAAIKDVVINQKRLRGASTITQQLARTLFLSREQSLKRKILEIRVARLLEENLSKKEIIEFYLNYVYWGKNHYGISNASAYYFKKPAELLSNREAVALISILPNPDICQNPLKCSSSSVQFRQRRIHKYLTRQSGDL